MENQLKSFLKAVKLNEGPISMVFGLIVVVVIGGLIVNYFRLKPAQLPTLNDKSNQQADEAKKAEYAETPAEALPPFKGELPTNYKIRLGDTLWNIAERYYQTGYAWGEIAAANKISNPSLITKDQELTIPQLSKAYPQTISLAPPAVGGVSESTLISESEQPTAPLPFAPTASLDGQVTDSLTGITYGPSISGNSYTIQKGDHLWGIAVRTYNDGYQWVKIAQANNLTNPNLIYAGGELILPR